MTSRKKAFEKVDSSKYHYLDKILNATDQTIHTHTLTTQPSVT